MDIMHAIMDIEQKAQSIVDSTDEIKDSQNAILADEIKKKEAEIEDRLAEQYAKLERESMLRRGEMMESLEKEYANKLEKLDEKCQAGKDKWIAEIVSAIVGE